MFGTHEHKRIKTVHECSCARSLTAPERVQPASSVVSWQSREQLRTSIGVYGQEQDWVALGSERYDEFPVSTCGVTRVQALPLCSIHDTHIRRVRSMCDLHEV